MIFKFHVFRYNPGKDGHPYFQLFHHEAEQKDSVLEALMSIRDHQDPTISLRYSCRAAVCGSCGMVINGRITLACRTTLESLETDEITVEPLPNLEIQKDLMVDMEPFWDALRYVEPYVLSRKKRPEKGYRIDEGDMEKIYQFINCIMCGCCYSACPVVARDDRYIGPASLAKLFRFIKDPRDVRPFSRWSKIDSPNGVWGCDTVFRCNEVCPKEVRPADGIQALRRKIIAEKIKKFFGKSNED